jgi:hypothetical protein
MWPWKVPKWPWFWAEVAVKAWQDLATLLDTDFTNGAISKYTIPRAKLKPYQNYISTLPQIRNISTLPHSVADADPDPGSGPFLAQGSGIRNNFFSRSRIPDPESYCIKLI